MKRELINRLQNAILGVDAVLFARELDVKQLSTDSPEIRVTVLKHKAKLDAGHLNRVKEILKMLHEELAKDET